MDALIFRSGWYFPFIKPDSSAGVYKYRRQLGQSIAASSHNLVAVVGDSRIGEGFSARVFDEDATNTPYKAVNLAVPGSSLRVWYYLLKQVDPGRNAFKFIVIPMSSYSENDEEESYTNRILDLQFLMAFASISESIEIVQSFTNAECQVQALCDALVQLYAMRLDVKDFLSDPEKRLADIGIGKKYSDYNYSGTDRKLADYLNTSNTSIDPQSREIIRRLKKRFEEIIPVQTGERHKYNSYWLNKLIADYKNSDTTLVLIKIPTDPIGRLHQPVSTTTVNDHVFGNKNVIVAPEKLFADLENPEYFFDDLHLNSSGRKIFSNRLSQLILQTLSHNNAIAVRSSSANE